MSEKKERNSNVELLRFFLMLGVCVLHMLVHGRGVLGAGYEFCNSDLLLLTIAIPSVNCFMFISGYYGIQLNLRKLIQLLLQASLIFWVLILLRNLTGLLGGTVSLKFILLHLLPVSTKAWWFLTEYVVIMLLSPFINEGIARLPQKKFFQILVMLGGVNCFGLYITMKHTGSDLLGLLFVYLLGRYLKMYVKTLSFGKSAFLWIASTVLLYLLMFFAHFFEKDMIIKGILYYCNPLIIVQSVGLFFFCNSFKCRSSKPLNWLGKHCFAIYLVSEFTGFYFYKKWACYYYDSNYLLLVISLLVVSFVIMFFDCLQSFVNKKLQNLIFNEK